jgi:hypothetical protein
MIVKRWTPSSLCYAQAFSGKPCPEALLLAAVPMIVFKNGKRAGVFRKMWEARLLTYDELKHIEWEWQAMNGAMTKAPLGAAETRPNPTDRAKSGTKRCLLTDGCGVPLSVAVLVRIGMT